MDSLDEVRYALLAAQQQAARANATAEQATAELRALRGLIERYGPEAVTAAQRGGAGIEALGGQAGRAVDTGGRLAGAIEHAASAADAASENALGLAARAGLAAAGAGAAAGLAYLIWGGRRSR